ncbi:MAG: Com family DNA-binding transcriptional regulator [Thermodesulfovibrionia bacterium]|nr:Com family DNA-binding transcriptional regulator [Thermodesulfovibrionia bacterium]
MKEKKPAELPNVRCKKCGKLLFKGEFTEIEVKCPRCNFLQTFRGAQALKKAS